MKSVGAKTFYHILLFSTLVFILYLLSGEYSLFPWSSHSDGYRFFHFVLTIPFPLIVVIILGIMEIRKARNWLSIIRICFPIICLVFSVGFLVLFHFIMEKKLSLIFSSAYQFYWFCVRFPLFITISNKTLNVSTERLVRKYSSTALRLRGIRP